MKVYRKLKLAAGRKGRGHRIRLVCLEITLSKFGLDEWRESFRKAEIEKFTQTTRLSP